MGFLSVQMVSSFLGCIEKDINIYWWSESICADYRHLFQGFSEVARLLGIEVRLLRQLACPLKLVFWKAIEPGAPQRTTTRLTQILIDRMFAHKRPKVYLCANVRGSGANKKILLTPPAHSHPQLPPLLNLRPHVWSPTVRYTCRFYLWMLNRGICLRSDLS
jgi:hypothetical protein